MQDANNLPRVKAIVESFKGSGLLVNQGKASLQTPGLAAQLLKIKDQCKCLVKLIDTMESAKFTIKEALQTIQAWTLKKTLAALALTFKKANKAMTFLK